MCKYVCVLCAAASALSGEEIPQGIVVVLIKGGVYERVEEGVGVTQPQEDALPDGWDVAGAQRDDELGDEEGDPAEDEHPNQNAYHQRCLFLLLLPPRVPVRLEGHCGMTDRKHHLGLLRCLLHLCVIRSIKEDKQPVSQLHSKSAAVLITETNNCKLTQLYSCQYDQENKLLKRKLRGWLTR